MARPNDKEIKPKTRIQIGPGGLMFFIVTGLILGVAIYANANLLYGAFGLMVGGLVVSVVMSWHMLNGVSVQRILPSHGVAGESVVLRYQIINRKRWMPVFGIVISETWGRGFNGWKKRGPIAQTPRRLKGRPFGWVLHLGPNQTVQAEAPCWPLRRGQLGFERIVVYTSFPFGIIRRVLEFEQPGSVLIYPHLYRINRHVLFSLSQADPHGRKRLERAGGHEEFFGLREYRAGDSLKMIDWKRSARTSKLISREMTQPSPPKIMIGLDMTGLDEVVDEQPKKRLGLFKSASKGNGEMTTEILIERAISLAASLVCDSYFHGYQVGMCVMGVLCVPFPVHHSLPHRTKMLEALSQLDASLTTDDTVPMPMPPSVIIKAGQGAASPGFISGTGAISPMVMIASEMEQYVIELAGGSGAVLNSRARPESRRQELAESAVTEEAKG